MSSFRIAISPKRRAAARFMAQARRSLVQALASNTAINQSDLSRALEIDRSVVSRQLNGTANLTLRGVAELAWAMGCRPELRLIRPEERAGDNANRWVPAESTPQELDEDAIVPFRAYAQSSTNAPSSVVTKLEAAE